MISKQYINANGFVTVYPDAPFVPGEGNGWLNTGVAFCMGIYDVQPIIGLMINACRKGQTPLVYRSPYKRNADDQETCDDYWGLIAMSRAWSKEILAWGETNGWDFDIQGYGNPDYRFDRFPEFAPLLRLRAGQSLTIWDQLIVAGSVLWDALHIDDADGNKRAFCKIYTARENPLASICCAIWTSRIKRRYGSVPASWSASLPKDHPLVGEMS